MSQGKKLPLANARQLADLIVADLAPGCRQILVAGSIRREKPEVSDIEIVAVPQRADDLLGGEGMSLLDPILERLCDKGVLRRLKGGEKYKQYMLVAHGANLDLFLASEDNYGLILAIRTGPAEWSKRLVTPRQQGGLMPSHMRVRDGRLWPSTGTTPIPVPSEAELFRVYGMEWVEPKERR